MTYVPTGPFTNGSSPGMSASFLNSIETSLTNLDGAGTNTVINGGTSGTATLYQVMSGTIKMVVVVLSNFRTAGANQDISIPTPFASSLWFATTDTNTFSLMLSGSAQNCAIITGLASGGGSNASSITSIGSNSFGYCNHGVDKVRFLSGAGSVHFGPIILIGV